jgi:hypothetical protein
MPTGKSVHTTGILEYALRHLENERAEIEARIEHVQRQLGRPVAKPASAAAPAAAGTAAPKKRVLSAAARKRIALAQKKRWAEHRKAEAAAAAGKK